MTSDEEYRLNDLLTHAGWVRRLAVSLVDGDVAAAEDLVQETWLAAVKRPPDEPGRPWLGRVLRNAWRQRRRSEHRRERREAVTDVVEPLPEPNELADRVERQRALAAAVRDLDEPFRATVILRYYEGLSSAEIARRCGEPADRVRWRLKRGIELLRTRLREQHGRDWASWCAAIVSFAPSAPTAAAIATTSSVGIGGLAIAMSTKSIVAAVVSIAAIVGWIQWNRESPDHAPAVGVALSEAAEARAEGSAPRPENSESTDVVRFPVVSISQPALEVVAPTSTTHGVVSGIVRARETDAPLADATVRLVRNDGEHAQEESTTIETDSNGRFRFDEVAADEYWVTCHLDGRAPHIEQAVEVNAGATRRLEIVLASGQSLRIQVVDTTESSAIAGATVTTLSGGLRKIAWYGSTERELRSLSAQTSRSGACSIAGLTPGSHQVIVQAKGYSNWMTEVTIRDFDDSLDVAIHRGGSFVGRVSRADGTSIAGSRVFLQPEQWGRRLASFDYVTNAVEVEANGSYRIDNVPVGRHFVAAVAPDGGAAFHSHRKKLAAVEIVDGVATQLDLEMPLPVTIRGRVVDRSGVPIAGAKTTISWGDFKAPRSGFFPLGSLKSVIHHSRMTDLEGRFEIAAMRASYEALTLRIRVDDYERGEFELEFRPGQVLARTFELTSLGASIRGRLIAPDGAPIRGGVRVAAWETDGERKLNLYFAAIDDDGRYDISLPVDVTNFLVHPILRDGDPWVSTPAERRAVPANTDGIDFVLRPKHVLTGSIRDGRGAPVRGFHVHVSQEDGSYELARDADSGDGQFRVPLESGAHGHLVFTADGFEPVRVTELQDTTPRELVMRRPPVFLGRVVDSAGGAVADALVCLASVDGESSPPQSEHTPFARTTPDGKFELHGVPVRATGHLLLAPQRDDTPALVRYLLADLDRSAAVLTIPTAHHTAFEIVDAGGAQASGRFVVLDADGWPIEPRIEAVFRDQHADRADLAGGRAERRLPDGTYVLLFFNGGSQAPADVFQFPFQVDGTASEQQFELAR